MKCWDALHDAVSDVLELSYDALTTPECLALLERQEHEARRLPAAGHPAINKLAREAGETELGGRLTHALANRLRITRAEASRRVHEAADLGERTAVTGEPLPPQLEATAAGQRDGQLGAGHVAVIRSFLHRLPDFVDLETRQVAEAQLARLGTQHRPDELSKLADKLTDCLNPDGNFTDEDRSRRRGITIGPQGADGMSPITGYLTPEARATVDAVFAKLAAPIENDSRSAAQRNHDALSAAGRLLLESGKLGQHNGLPATIIVTTTLRELESGCGRGLTGGGTLLPMSDVIRLAGNAHHYLAIFDKGRALALYHTKRLASPAQRIVLYAKDRGCSFPGCEIPGYHSEAHHCDPYARCGTSDVNDMTFGCGGHHPLAEQGWTTRKNQRGETEWIPPAHLDHGQPRTNTFHHPEKLLQDDDEDP
ncbi:HNH endonuclease signature motif containing protein [Mycobacterium cookii]|uniref:DUF222 domain-containing protein n=1 Tax=Mycobacterium cookii TaxID=1775 RepID=A0A7I7KYG0_9MYCO|nr:hypothetical protein MCOO_30080 [Mycobacterium cookii]